MKKVMENANRNLNRRDLLNLSAGLGTSALLGSNSWAAPPPYYKQRAVFIFVPMGTLPNEWKPDHCSPFSSYGAMLQPFAPVADRCFIPAKMRQSSSGFGQMPNHLCKNPFSPGSNSLDTLVANQLNSKHLRLLAGERNDYDRYSVTVVDGEPVALAEFENWPENLVRYLQPSGLTNEYYKSVLDEQLSDQHSIFSAQATMFLELTKAALITGYSDVVTLMLGGDNARILPPKNFPLPQTTLRELPSTNKLAEFVLFKQYIHTLIAQFILDLASTPAPEMPDDPSRSLLDFTMVYVFSNMGNSLSYSDDNAPVIIAGSDRKFTGGNILTGKIAPVQEHYHLLNAIAGTFFLQPSFGDTVALNVTG